MRWFCFAVLLAAPAFSQPVLYACASFTKEYVVGAKLPPSGLFRLDSGNTWQHQGFNHPFVFGLESDPRDPRTLFLAAGNGLIRLTAGTLPWTVLTGSDVTELRDVAVDPASPGTLYFAHTRGIRVTHDGGLTWQELGATLHRRYTEAIRLDPHHAGVLLGGTEEGIFRSEDAGRTWHLAGAAGYQILRIEPSPHRDCFWLATTQQGGLFASQDCGRSFENSGTLGVGRNLYDIAFDPTQPGRIAVAGWGTGVAVSTDDGRTWQLRNNGLPGAEVTAAAFDPAKPGRLFAAVHEQAVFVSDDAGFTWRSSGLEGSHVSRLRFSGDVAAR